MSNYSPLVVSGEFLEYVKPREKGKRFDTVRDVWPTGGRGGKSIRMKREVLFELPHRIYTNFYKNASLFKTAWDF